MRSYADGEDWKESFKDVSQMLIVKQSTKNYPPTFLSARNSGPFENQDTEFSKKLQKSKVPVDTLFCDGAHHLHHQYQFHLNKPESIDSIKKVLLFLSRNTSPSGIQAEGKP